MQTQIFSVKKCGFPEFTMAFKPDALVCQWKNLISVDVQVDQKIMWAHSLKCTLLCLCAMPYLQKFRLLLYLTVHVRFWYASKTMPNACTKDTYEPTKTRGLSLEFIDARHFIIWSSHARLLEENLWWISVIFVSRS